MSHVSRGQPPLIDYKKIFASHLLWAARRFFMIYIYSP